MENNNVDFEQIITEFSDDVKNIAIGTRKLIYSILPNVVEVIWQKQNISGYGTGKKKNTEHFCWIMPTKNYVNLGFNYGAELPDSKKLLEGTGKLYRHIKIKSIEQLSDKDLIELLKFATTYKVPKI